MARPLYILPRAAPIDTALMKSPGAKVPGTLSYTHRKKDVDKLGLREEPQE